MTSVKYDGASGYNGVVLLGNDSIYDGTSANYPAGVGGWAGAGSTAGAGGVPNGVYGYTDNGAGNGVVGYNSNFVPGSGAGVLGLAFGASATAVEAVNTAGTAVSGSSGSTDSSATAINGVISSTTPGGFSSAVRGQNNGTGGLGIGVYGSHAGSGWGMYATSASGIGVNANGGTGVGVDASGATGVEASGSAVGLQAFGPTAVSATASGSTGVGLQASGRTGAKLTGTGTGLLVSGPTAVSATATGNGAAIIATATSNNPTVKITNSGTGPALSVNGPVQFSRSGTAVVAGSPTTSHSGVTIYGVKLTAATTGLATLQTHIIGIGVAAVVINVAAQSFTVYLTAFINQLATVEWLLIN